MEQSRIERINELSRLSRIRELTEDEKAERALLRAEYVAAVRKNMQAQLDNTFIVDDDGTKHPLRKKD